MIGEGMFKSKSQDGQDQKKSALIKVPATQKIMRWYLNIRLRIHREQMIMISLWGGSALMVLFSYPFVNDIPAKRAELETTKQEVVQIKAMSESVKRLSNQISLYIEDEKALTRAVPDTGSAPLLFEQIQKIATDSGIDLQSLSYQGIRASASNIVDQGLGSVAMTISVMGTFEKLTNFLSNIENASPILLPQNLSLSQASDGNVNMSVPLISYYLKVPPITEENLLNINVNIMNDTLVKKAIESARPRKYYSIEVKTKEGIGKTDPFTK